MRENNRFQNLWIYDLVALLALMFMAIIFLKMKTDQKYTLPILKAGLKKDHDNLNVAAFQIQQSFSRLSFTPERTKRFTLFQETNQELYRLLNDRNLISAINDTSIDVFVRIDTLVYKKQSIDNFMDNIINIRDTLIGEYFRETKIEKKRYTEENIMFPTNMDKPYPYHPDTKKSQNIILKEIYSDVDSILKLGYNVIKVIGHTDPRQNEKYNRDLSRRRAEYLADKIRNYIDRKYGSSKPVIVEATGYGEFDLLTPDKSESVEKYYRRLRRVELVFSRIDFSQYDHLDSKFQNR